MYIDKFIVILILFRKNSVHFLLVCTFLKFVHLMSKNKIPGNTCIYNLKFNIGHKRDLQFFTQSFMCSQTYLPKHKVVYFIVNKPK